MRYHSQEVMFFGLLQGFYNHLALDFDRNAYINHIEHGAVITIRKLRHDIVSSITSSSASCRGTPSELIAHIKEYDEFHADIMVAFCGGSLQRFGTRPEDWDVRIRILFSITVLLETLNTIVFRIYGARDYHSRRHHLQSPVLFRSVLSIRLQANGWCPHRNRLEVLSVLHSYALYLSPFPSRRGPPAGYADHRGCTSLVCDVSLNVKVPIYFNTSHESCAKVKIDNGMLGTILRRQEQPVIPCSELNDLKVKVLSVKPWSSNDKIVALSHVW